MKKILSSFALALTLAVSAIAQSPSAFIPVPQGKGLAARGVNGQDVAVIGIDKNNDTAIYAPSGEQIVAKIAGTPAVTLSSTTTAIAGNQTISGTLGVTGAATLSSTLAVTGASTLTGAVSTGALTVKASANTKRVHNLGASSDTALTYVYGDGTTAGQTLSILNASADGSDNGALLLSGGGAVAAGRGGALQLYGNENGTWPGYTFLATGDAAGADMYFTSIDEIFMLPGQAQSAEFLANKNIYFNSTTSVGWTLQAAANQACNTTCTYACIVI